MPNKPNGLFYVIFGFVAIGLLSYVLNEGATYRYPVLIIGGIVAAYAVQRILMKRRIRSRHPNKRVAANSRASMQKPKPKAKSFKVISGGRSETEREEQ